MKNTCVHIKLKGIFIMVGSKLYLLKPQFEVLQASVQTTATVLVR